MTVVMEKHTLITGILAQCRAIPARLIDSWVKAQLVACSHAKLLILRLKSLSDVVHRGVTRRTGRDGRVNPTLQLGARVCLDNVRRVDADVQAKGEYGRDGLQPVLHAPFLERVYLAVILGVAVCLVLLVGEVHEERRAQQVLVFLGSELSLPAVSNSPLSIPILMFVLVANLMLVVSRAEVALCAQHHRSCGRGAVGAVYAGLGHGFAAALTRAGGRR